MKLTGKNGVLRIYDSSDIVAHGAQANMSVFTYVDIGTVYTDKTAEAYVDDASYTGAFWAAASDKIYVGQTTKFARIQFAANVLAVAAGVLVPKYYNGATWAALTGVSDGTASGGNTLAQDGVISFQIPRDWAKGGGGSLSSSMYYIQLAPTDVPSTAPDADLLAPVDGQYFEVVFANTDFNAPLARPRTEEILVLNRGKMDAHAHYKKGPDEPLYEPLDETFSCALDDTANREYIHEAIACGNPGAGNWTAAGVTSKGTTKNDGTNFNPSFVDSSKKTVNVQVLWIGDNPIGYSYYEVFFPGPDRKISESVEAVPVSLQGGIFGVVERIYGFGNRY